MDAQRWRRNALRSLALSVGLTLLLALVFSPGLAWLRGDDASQEPVPAAPKRSSWAVAQEPAEPEAREMASLDRKPPPTGDVELIEPPPPEDPGASTLDCIIEPSELVDIGSPVTGLIEAIPVERSDFVGVGQIVAELEDTVEREAAALAEARATMDGELRLRQASAALGERRERRARNLFERSALSDELRDEAETEAEVARLEFERAQEDQQLASLQLSQALAILDRRTIRSPIAGVVVERLMAPGERVDEETILRIAKIDPLQVEVILPSALFGTIQPGAKAAVTPEIPGDEVHVASVTIVDPVIDAASGTFGVQLELPNPDYAIPGGLHCQVRFLDE